jgi:hypothetical protein
MSTQHPSDLRVTPDAARLEAGRRLWRRLLSAPPLAADLADAIERADPEAAGLLNDHLEGGLSRAPESDAKGGDGHAP